MEPLHYPFVRNGLLEALLLGAACGLIGPFVVERQLTFFGHALSHTLFPGLVLAALFGIQPVVAAAVGAALTVALVWSLQHRPAVGDDSAVGVVFLGLFALGVVLVGWFHVRSPDVGAAVVGNLLGVGPVDLLASGALVLALAGLIGGFYRPLVLATFDRLAAQALALPLRLLDLALLAGVAATAVIGVKAVGVILTVAVLVTPAAAARLWCARLPRIMLLASAFGGFAGAVGLYAASNLRVAPAAITVLLLGLLFAASLAVGPRSRVGWGPTRARPQSRSRA